MTQIQTGVWESYKVGTIPGVVFQKHSKAINNKVKSTSIPRTMSETQRAGGHKANLNNPNTSEESKQHSRDILDGDLKDAAQRGGQGSQEGKNPGNGSSSLPCRSI